MYRLFNETVPSEDDVLAKSYSAIYKIEGEDIVVDSCNDGYKSIYGLAGDLQGKSFVEITGKPTYYNSIKEMMIYNDSSILSFMREINGAFWRVTMKVHFPFCEFICYKLNQDEIFSSGLEIEERVNSDSSSAVSILLCKEKDGYKVESFCKNADKFFNISYNSNLSEDNWNWLTFLNGTAIFDECLNKNKLVRFTDEFYYGESHKYVLTTIVPIKHNESDKLLVAIRFLDRSEYYAYLKRDFTYCNTDIHPTLCAAWYDYDHKCLQHSNQNFDKLFSDRQDYLNDIYSNIIVQNAIRSKSLSFGKMNIPMKNGESECYFCCAMPLVFKKSVLLLMTTEGQNNCSLIKTSKKLTKREGEILDFIVLGNKNTYIAKMLGVKEGTVKKIISNMYRKLDVSSRVELIRLIYYFDEGKRTS